jgi:hypothetical protein
MINQRLLPKTSEGAIVEFYFGYRGSMGLDSLIRHADSPEEGPAVIDGPID